MVQTFSVAKPGSTACTFMKLFRRSPACVTSTSDVATSATTSPLRRREVLRPGVAWRDAEAESDAFGFKETNDYGAFLADAKRDLTIARLATFIRMEANSRPFPKKKSR